MTISVIIPNKGRVALLERCLQSIRAQTMGPAACIIVDDGNELTDAVRIGELARMYDSLVIRQDVSHGAAVARNIGARAATGDLLFFCDSDVVLDPTALEKLHHALVLDPSAAFSYCDHTLDGRVMAARPFDVAALRVCNYISTTSLVRRSAFTGFDEQLKRFQDWDLWLTMAAAGAHGAYVPELLYASVSGGSMSQWLPSFVVRHAAWFMWWPAVRRYAVANAVIAEKHHLDPLVRSPLLH